MTVPTSASPGELAVLTEAAFFFFFLTDLFLGKASFSSLKRNSTPNPSLHLAFRLVSQLPAASP